MVSLKRLTIAALVGCVAISLAFSAAWWITGPTIPVAAKGFSDCDNCPFMLSLPGGTFHMGRQPLRREILLGAFPFVETPPLRTVDVQPFALARTEVTIAQWEVCVLEGACRRPGAMHADADGNHPVTNISWHDAQDYTRWLSKKTGQRYRLPSDAEWEYAARAGTRTLFHWGQVADRNYANFGKEECPPCYGETGGRDHWVTTAPVAQFLPNKFGFHDMNGNVYEWVEDCLSEVPPERITASPIIKAGCPYRVMRGGGWHSNPRRIESDYRAYNPPSHSDDKIGLRVARALK